MLNAEITIERSPEIVWTYFTEPRNFEKWWGRGLKAAQWRQGGKLEWASGDSSPIEAIVPGRMVQIAGSWMSTTFTFEPKGSGKTVVRIQESSPKGGASYRDGGTSELAQLNSSLVKLKEHVESEAEQKKGGNMSATEYLCPHCGSELQGNALRTVKVSMQVGVVDFQTICSSCGRAIQRRDIESSLKKSVKQSSPEKRPLASPAKKWWEFWKRGSEDLKPRKGELLVDNKSTEEHFSQALLYLQQGRKLDAVKEYESVININPNLSEAHFNLGVLYGQLGRREDARRELKIAADKGNEEARQVLATLERFR